VKAAMGHVSKGELNIDRRGQLFETVKPLESPPLQLQKPSPNTPTISLKMKGKSA